MPSRSINVSTLSRDSRMGRLPAADPRPGPGLERADKPAWSLCCQQYRSGLPGSSRRRRSARFRGGWGEEPGDAARGRLHGRPPPVTPRHVPSEFLESERASRDSGVLGMNGIVVRRFGVSLNVTFGWKRGKRGKRERERERRYT